MIPDLVRRAVRGLRAARRERLPVIRIPDPSGIASTASPVTTGAAERINEFEVLDQVLRLPVNTWRYDGDPPHVRHVGPMAPDWHEAFGLGVDDLTISCTDTNGVALASIQALHRLIVELRTEVDELRERLDQEA